MKIVDAQVFVTSPGRNFVTLKVATASGVTGYGDATLNGRELAVAAYLNEHLVPLLIGRDAGRIEDTWQYLYKGAYWRRGPVTMTAISAVDTALWDIKGKAAGLPVYQLLGGASRNGVLAYCHATGRDVPELLDNVGHARDQGYRAIRVQSSVPGMSSVYGVPASGGRYEPADGDVPGSSVWETDKYLRFVPGMLDQVRSTYGHDFAVMHDVHHRLTPIEAARLAKSVEDFGLMWLEDPVPAELQEGFRLIRQHSTTPIAVGEVLNSIWDYQQLITEQLIDFVRASVVHAGGITHLRRILHLAELYHVKGGAHGATDLSPVSFAAQLHLSMALPNVAVQEHMPHDELTDAVFPHSYSYRDGYLTPGDEPGLGVGFDEKLAATFPYRRAYLPVATLADGTAHSW